MGTSYAAAADAAKRKEQNGSHDRRRTMAVGEGVKESVDGC